MKFWWVSAPQSCSISPLFISLAHPPQGTGELTGFISCCRLNLPQLPAQTHPAGIKQQRLKLPEGPQSSSGEKLDVPDMGSDHPKLICGAFPA